MTATAAGGSRSGRARARRRCVRAARPRRRARHGGTAPRARRSCRSRACGRARVRAPAESTVHRPRRTPGHRRPHEARAEMTNTGGPRARCSASRRSGRPPPSRRGTRSTLPGQVRRAAAGDHDAAAPAREHARDRRAAAEVHAEHVHLERPPPVGGSSSSVAPRVPMPAFATRSSIGPVSAKPRSTDSRDVTSISIARPPISRGDVVDLIARPRRHDDVAAVACERTRDVRADPAAAAGDQRDAPRQRPPRSPRATRGSRATTGRRDRCRVRSRGPRDARSWPSASSAVRPRRRCGQA